MSPYTRLITGKRLKNARIIRPDLSLEMLSDKIRIVNSTAFRRLQTKAQVFSLEDNPAIRSRLTHTLEVAIYGEFLARVTFEKLEKSGLIEPELRFPYTKTVENACLLHDLGNPPFGHLGEYAIRKWFIDNEQEVKRLWKNSDIDDSTIQAHIPSFIHFDGNAQGLRTVMRLQWLDNCYGLNLSCTLLASMVKYLGSEPRKKKPFCAKIGFFESERSLVEQVWTTLGMTCQDGLLLHRHPLAYLMEAADDIAYGVSDIEDAIEKHLVTEAEFFAELESRHEIIENIELNQLIEPHAPEGAVVSSDMRFIWFRINTTRFLIERAAHIYVSNHQPILDGTFGFSLLKADPASKCLLDFLHDFTTRHVFFAREAASIELGGHQAIFDILDKLSCLLNPDKDVFAKLVDRRPIEGGEWAYERRLMSVLSKKHLVNYRSQCREAPASELIWRTHLVVDYVAGMTDEHAMKTARMLTGGAMTTR